MVLMVGVDDDIVQKALSLLVKVSWVYIHISFSDDVQGLLQGHHLLNLDIAKHLGSLIQTGQRLAEYAPGILADDPPLVVAREE